MYIVYALEDPRDHLYHYIGITNDVYKRFDQHVKGASGNIEKNGWIFECRQANIMILMREIERLPTYQEAFHREHFWIFYYLQLGHPLSNLQHAKTIQEEKYKLERQYHELLMSKALMEDQLVAELPKAWRTPPSASDVAKVMELRRKGSSLRKIVEATGIRYNQVRRINLEMEESQSLSLLGLK